MPSYLADNAKIKEVIAAFKFFAQITKTKDTLVIKVDGIVVYRGLRKNKDTWIVRITDVKPKS